MRSKAAAAVLGVVAIWLAVSNPDKDDFVRWFERKAEAAARGQNVLSGLSLLERTLEVKTSLRRDNYVLFSVFHVRVMRRDHVFLGFLGGFRGLADAGEALPGGS
jgi:hypothetical protein